MMRHIVLFRKRTDIPRNEALEAGLAKRMRELGARIPAVKSWVFRANELQRPICWDYVLESEVDDVESLVQYLSHPLHQELVADLKPYFEWAAADYTTA